ncbi:D-alanyl-D-alanine carboxypeptidase family protein [Euzebya sp.]|uniref:D-alanyl-D-alanine carboxypeptidase family protein n=1 Tax=Euzebya sp. TaxID=1971409 RepID=UPI00351992AB
MSGPTTGRSLRRLLAAVGLLLALSLAGPATATVVEPTTVPLDPDAPAAAPGVPVDAPLQAGVTPEEVASRPVPGPTPDPPTISAAGAVLLDPADGVVLAGVDPRTPRRMASTTKVMTILLALEAVESGRVPPTLTVSAEAAATGQLPGVATLGLTEGQVVDFRDLLAADLLRSGNDGAVAIAEHVAGSEEAYVAMMNLRAETLGLEDTAFVDSTGLSVDLAHHATPLDLALLGQEAMTHEDFAAWAGAATLTVEPFGLLENRNEMLTAYPGTTGIKTGYTELAGLCLVASAERDGRTLYAVVLGSEDRVADTTALFDHGFTDYARPTPLTPSQVAATYRTAHGEVPVSAAEELARTVGGGAEVEVVTRLAPDAALPIDVGTPLGEAVLVVDGQEVDRTALLADTAVAPAADDAGAALADAVRAFARLAEQRQPVAL